MATATRGWKAETVTIRTEGNAPKKRIRIPYTVPDAATREEALAADGLPNYGDPLSENSPYKVVAIDANCSEGPTFWTVPVDYEVSSIIWDNPIDNPMSGPPIVTWGKAMRTVTIRADCNNNPIINSAGSEPDPFCTREIEIETMRITRWELFYNREFAREFRQHTNANAFTLGATLVRPGEMLCTSILPMEPFNMTTAAFVHMAYDFELCVDLRGEPTQSGAPFDYHLNNKGRLGWYFDSGEKRGPIVDANGKPVDEDVWLKLDGRPVDSTLKIGKGLPADGIYETATPTSTPTNVFDLFAVEESPFSTATRPVILYRRYPRANMALLTF